MFENLQSYSKGHIKGYITDGSTFPDDSVQSGSYNMDYQHTHDSIRPPYRRISVSGETDLEVILDGDYDIIGLHEKEFIDNDSNSVACIIAVVKHSTNHNIKIYINKFYNPTTAFGNNHNGTVGWTDGWVDLTEGFNITEAVTSVATIGGGDPYKAALEFPMSVGNEIYLDKPTNYYKGWFMYNSTGVCVGQVTAYTYNGTHGSFAMGINSIISGGTTIAIYNLTLPMSNFYIVRFPLNDFAFNEINNIGSLDTFENVTRCSIEDTFNSVKICIGNGFRPIRIAFLQGKEFWADAQQEANFSRAWDGFWMRYDCPKVDDIETIIKKTGESGSTDAQYFDHTVIGKELGIRIKNTFFLNPGAQDSDYLTEMVYSNCITFDGFQTFFLKYFVGEAHTDTGPDPDEPKIYLYADSEIHLLVDFDRSITSVNYFGKMYSLGTINYDRLISYRYADDTFGTLKTERMTKVGAFNYYKSTVTILNRPHILTAISEGDLRSAAGATLEACLNAKYYHSPVSAFSLLFKVGKNFVGADISPDYLEVDSPLHDKFGAAKIVVSQVQFQGYDGTPVNAESCFGEERIQHLIAGEKIVAGVSTIGNNFLLFTNRALYAYEIVDDSKLSIKTDLTDYLYRGTYGPQTVVKAQLGDQFAGVYWLGRDTIYRMLNNQPEDILFNRWRDEYQDIAEEDKQNAVCGFNARTKNVFFKIGSKIYIWNLDYEHWRVYQFTDLPINCFTSITGEMMFVSGADIYITDKQSSALFLDDTTKPIGFKYVKEINFGTKVSNKIADLLRMFFSITPTDSLGEFDVVNLLVKLGSEGLTNNLLDKLVNISEKKKYNIATKLRKPTKQCRLEISTEHNTDDNIKYFELSELLVTAKQATQEVLK